MGNTPCSRDLRRCRPVHPHARGEHGLAPVAARRTPGSSPRTWGTQQNAHEDTRRRRFIPTHVGNTAAPAPMPQLRSVHPHARGEHGYAGLRPSLNSGSSPRTWGTPARSCALSRCSRFIPTHVGNTDAVDACHVTSSVHPHARGEHGIALAAKHIYSGSSPRTWGTRSRDAPLRQPRRFIPTHVGNTFSAWLQSKMGSVHPHARGEHVRRGNTALITAGSSPRTWGTRARSPGVRTFCRFIPTHVGNTPLLTH